MSCPPPPDQKIGKSWEEGEGIFEVPLGWHFREIVTKVAAPTVVVLQGGGRTQPRQILSPPPFRCAAAALRAAWGAGKKKIS